MTATESTRVVPLLASDCELGPGDVHLDTARYTSPEFHRRELDRLWARCWQVVCREDDLAEVGSFREHHIGDRSYLVVRGNDQRIRAFQNVCLHRSNRLCTGSGRVGSIRCPYHAWTWRLDGTLARIPDRDLFAPIDDSEYALGEIGCDTWGGFVFVVPEPEGAPTLREHLHPLPDEMAAYRLESYVPVGINVELPVACNWKAFQDAFMETYHLPFIHSQMLHFANELGTRFALLGEHSLMVTPFAEASNRARGVTEEAVLRSYLDQLPVTSRKLLQSAGGQATMGPLEVPDGATARSVVAGLLRAATERTGFDTAAFSDDQITDVWQYSAFPNTLMSCHPGHVLVTWVLPHPSDPNRCRARIVNLRWTRDGERDEAREPLRILEEEDLDEAELSNLGKAIEQDLANLPGQQLGLRSGQVSHQTLSRHETRIAHLHRVIDGYLER